RRRANVPVVAIVGYTNAGKSTLLNTVTQSEVRAEDLLFATLDPTVRRVRFPREREIVMLDTVGFIRDLPPALMQAFSATLEEVSGADLLLHVVDLTDPDQASQLQTVEHILEQLDAGSVPRFIVFNKCDSLGDAAERGDTAALGATAVGGLNTPRFFISAIDRRSTRGLMEAIEAEIWGPSTRGVVHSTPFDAEHDPAASYGEARDDSEGAPG
ncbi:MAG: GTPase, partial [Nannocystaceae bacterium]